jgi:putative sterol carrier protein
MIENIFRQLPDSLVAAAAARPVSYYFSLGDCRKTVVISPVGCTVADGKTVENADCVCKTSPEFFLRIWEEGYRPGMKDFLTGTIKSNDPGALQHFLKCFGKEL